MSRLPRKATGKPRKQTVAVKRITRAELAAGRLAFPPVDDSERPVTREDCHNVMRPCPWVSCKFHLYLDVNPETGSITINFPDLEPWELRDTCALDVAERGGTTLEEVGEIMNLTRERIRQLEVRGLIKLKTSGSMRELAPEMQVRKPKSSIVTVDESKETQQVCEIPLADDDEQD